MRAIIQRVSKAKVRVEQKTISEISQGILILLGIENEDNVEDIEWLSNKIASLRIFDDKENTMNLCFETFIKNKLTIGVNF